MEGLHDEILNLLRSRTVRYTYEIYDALKNRPAGEITQAIDVLKEEGFIVSDTAGFNREAAFGLFLSRWRKN